MDKVSALLSDPEMSAKIAAIAGSLSGGGAQSAPSPPAQAVQQAERVTQPKAVGNAVDPRIALLSSIKPLLRQEKRQKVDNLVRAMTVVSMLGGLKRGGDT